MVFEWYKVKPEAYAINKTIGELQIRQRTGAMITLKLGKAQP